MSAVPLPAESRSRTAFATRARATLIHAAISAAVALVVAAFVFAIWYPRPFGDVSGGRDLFLLLIVVDVVIGPLLTFAVFDRRKPRAELRRDLTVVVLLQLAALVYGLHTVALARPAVLALEGDRLRVVRAVDLAQADFSKAPEGLKALSWLGPVYLATRTPTADEMPDAIERGLAGEDIGMRPQFWRPLSETRAAYAKAAKPLAGLTRLHPERAGDLRKAIDALQGSAQRLGYLPILARSTDWSALVDLKDGSIVGYVPIDGF
jgi:energy-coupling factor transporter transmembrane protein EcfT